MEVYPDEGDIDFVKAIRVYKEVGYPYMLMPDHVPLAAESRSPDRCSRSHFATDIFVG